MTLPLEYSLTAFRVNAKFGGERSSRRSIFYSAIPSALLPAGQPGWYQAPSSSAVQGRNGDQVECRDKKAVKAQEGQQCVDGFESRVTEYGDPGHKRDPDYGLRDNSAPGDYAPVQPGPRFFEATESNDGIKFNRPSFVFPALGRDHVATLVDQEDAQIGEQPDKRHDWALD